MPYRFSIKSANPKKPEVIHITAPKHTFDELVKLNGVEYKGKLLFIDNVKVKPTVANPNYIKFTFPNRFEPLRFVNNSPHLGNDIDHSEEGNLLADFKRTIRKSKQSSKFLILNHF